MRRQIVLGHVGGTAVLKRPWQGEAEGTVVGWWSGGFKLVIGGERLDFAFSEIEKVLVGGAREAEAA